MTPDMMASWMDITGATDAAYTVMDADEGYHLRATAMYDDGEGMGKMASMQTMMVTHERRRSEFADSEDGARSVAENTGASMEIGAPVTATDANDDTLTTPWAVQIRGQLRHRPGHGPADDQGRPGLRDQGQLLRHGDCQRLRRSQ